MRKQSSESATIRDLEKTRHDLREEVHSGLTAHGERIEKTSTEFMDFKVVAATKEFVWKITGLLAVAMLFVAGFVWSEVKETRGKLEAYEDKVFQQMQDQAIAIAEIRGDVKALIEDFKRLEPVQ